jgi:hypothetical protein
VAAFILHRHHLLLEARDVGFALEQHFPDDGGRELRDRVRYGLE